MSSIPVKTDPASLIVEGLTIGFPGAGTGLNVVNDVSFSLGRERVAIVGESGSGKSMTGRSLLRLTPPKATVSARRMSLDGIDILAQSDRQMRRIRGRKITMIMQDPRYSLHPVVSVGRQIAEAYRVLQPNAGKNEAREKALSMLEAVQIVDPNRVYDLHRHEVSGGMGQRIMIAMMLVQDPDYIIADEPTSALDVVVRQQVLEILDGLVTERGIGLLFISHDLNLVRTFCDRMLVMYRGRIVEELAASEFSRPQHAYTQGLMNALPSYGRRGAALPVLHRDPRWLTP
jgi:peptide/nickel transport system ATP-binding protein